MKTILEIIREAGGWRPSLYLKIENPPHPQLVIEAMDESGPCGLPAILIAQYGDALANPEMYFELGFAGGAHLNPFYRRDDYAGEEQWSRYIHEDDYVYLLDIHQDHEKFARTWDSNLHSQGFSKAFTDKCILG